VNAQSERLNESQNGILLFLQLIVTVVTLMKSGHRCLDGQGRGSGNLEEKWSSTHETAPKQDRFFHASQT
jgi:hypothetical protein